MALMTQPGAPRDYLSRLLLWSLLSVVLIAVLGLGVRSLVWQEPVQQLFPGVSSAHLPIYGAVPDFALTDQAGRAVRRADLEGNVWVASLIFTSCPDECPLMTAEMAQLQSDLAHVPDLRLVSISVDPERDTPAVLSQYADRFNADPARWRFLTGDKHAIYRLVKDGFRLGIVDPGEPSYPSPVKDSALGGSRWLADRSPPSSAAWTAGWPQTIGHWLRSVAPAVAFADHGGAKDPLHSTRFVLIDRRAQIRGYYDSQEEVALQRLRQHLQILLREG
jgi:cytochrome oxidase Cu insertion factor (SCO1/SenC/PrrC family)